MLGLIGSAQYLYDGATIKLSFNAITAIVGRSYSSIILFSAGYSLNLLECMHTENGPCMQMAVSFCFCQSLIFVLYPQANVTTPVQKISFLREIVVSLCRMRREDGQAPETFAKQWLPR